MDVELQRDLQTWLWPDEFIEAIRSMGAPHK
jgi:hypothetical protein